MSFSIRKSRVDVMALQASTGYIGAALFCGIVDLRCSPVDLLKGVAPQLDDSIGIQQPSWYTVIFNFQVIQRHKYGSNRRQFS
jgi:hypothetical protein